ncbi:hypothetical protein Scep_012909 [Stephania cephalantha]|uniref:Uncharacterized protein n=1 Tax=Stephania cephalantha TaxID=152367 RepID=A0AAP0JH92_9MAGN
MAIVLCNKTIIKPLPSSSNPNASPQLVPLTIFDKAAFDLHINVLYAFRPPLPSNEVLKNALSEVLVYFPHLAGRFKTDDKGRSCIVLNNAGIRVIDAYLPISLSEQLPFDPSEEHNHLLASVEGVHKRFLLQIQLASKFGNIFVPRSGGLLVFLPSCSDHGGVDVLISLLPQHAQVFRQISHSLD